MKVSGISTLVIQFELKNFEKSEDVTFPSWKNIKKVYSPYDVNPTGLGSSKQNIRNFMAIPHFIAKFLNSSPSIKPSEILVHRLAETNGSNAKHKGLNGFPRVEEETRDLIKFLWAASLEKFPATIYIDSMEPRVL